MVAFMDCMKTNNFDSHKCRNLSKAYLQCRMDNELMANEEFPRLGFHSGHSDDTQ